ncbi:ABC transporter permease [Catenulispora yoronensis]|uniref:ABC transporter permease n=1 Tax=Catenulispora yoronensis TaxID=450799 RepID=A0ABN2TNP3_9ACTN
MAPTKQLARRLGQAVVVLLLVSVIVFTLEHLLPGGPARAELGTRATPSAIEAFNRANGLDQPIPGQYLNWLGQLLQGDLGYSYQQNQSVNALLSANLPKTLVLTGTALLVAVVLAIGVGIAQAAQRKRPLDAALSGLAFTLYSMPVFWLALLLVDVFAVRLGVLPAEAPQGDLAQVLSHPQAMVLPVLTIALVTLAAFSRYIRSSLTDELTQDYVRAAKARGASRSRVLLVHALRNALIPVVTLIGLSLPSLIGGAVIVEVVFNYPGMGLLLYHAALSDDYPVLLGVSMAVATATVLGSFLADAAYQLVDPRVRSGR